MKLARSAASRLRIRSINSPTIGRVQRTTRSPPLFFYVLNDPLLHSHREHS